jgi:hypothetical protein
MKIKELIKQLEAVLDEKGNLDVMLGDTGTESMERLVELDVYEFTEDTPNEIWLNLISDTFKEQCS